MKHVVLLYSRDNEPVTAALIKEYRHHQHFIALSAEKLLADYTINDSIIDGVPNVEWSFNNILIRNDTDTLLINRLMEIPSSWFNGFAVEDRAYAKDEFIAYLSFAIESFPNKTANVSYLGLSGNHYPLPVLWQKINIACPTINTPEYYFGPQKFSTLSSTSILVQKDLFDHVKWKSTNAVKLPEQTSVFEVKRPPGEPIVVYTANDSQSIALADESKSSVNIAQHIQKKILEAAKTMTESLGCFFTQSLFFQEGEDLCFASISPYIFSPATHPDFNSVTTLSLKNHLGGLT
jgi:hypothetical protein